MPLRKTCFLNRGELRKTGKDAHWRKKKGWDPHKKKENAHSGGSLL